MLDLPEKLQCAPALLPMLVKGQPFIDAQDELSVLEFMRKYGMPERINEEVFISMAKALDFIDPDMLSMTVVLTALNRFLNEDNGLQMAFLDGNQPDRLCAPLREAIEKNGGSVHLSRPVKEIVTNDDGTVKHLLMRDGEEVRRGKRRSYSDFAEPHFYCFCSHHLPLCCSKAPTNPPNRSLSGRRGRVHQRHARRHCKAHDAEGVVHHAFLPPVRRAGGEEASASCTYRVRAIYQNSPNLTRIRTRC